MLNSILQFFPIAQMPLAQAGQVLLVVGVSFAVIILIRSTYRFYRMMEISNDELTTVKDCNDFFFVQVARYLSKISRSATGFGVLIVQFSTAEADKRAVQKNLLEVLQRSVRVSGDKACFFSDDCVGIILDCNEDRVRELVERILNDLRKEMKSLPGVDAFRAGVSVFPLNGSSSQVIIDAAVEALKKSQFDDPKPFCFATASEGIAPLAPESGELPELGKQDKNSALDPLTGVLNPVVVGSYMRKYLANIRQNKEPAALLCVGINQLDQIVQLHGEQAIDDVIVGVSKIIQRLTRDGDLIGRYHRDDFIILAACSLRQGEMIATRLREAVQKEFFISGAKRIKATVSVGISAHPEHGRNLRDLFRGSYRALEIVRDWETSACLMYDPAKHAKKTEHETRRKH
ncbi:MAG: GGDEF domain-containing protein [Pontiellaceae bacterium]|jgi:diguanylate cyclase (GGDEF)-like protein|nr:GGDEF domain-containing protein [Pontiellaceae bacterium]